MGKIPIVRAKVRWKLGLGLSARKQVSITLISSCHPLPHMNLTNLTNHAQQLQQLSAIMLGLARVHTNLSQASRGQIKWASASINEGAYRGELHDVIAQMRTILDTIDPPKSTPSPDVKE